MGKLKKITTGISGHIISGLIFLIVIEPLLKVTYGFLVFEKNSFIDSIYYNAARNNAVNSSVFFITFLILEGGCLFFFDIMNKFIRKLNHQQFLQKLALATDEEKIDLWENENKRLNRKIGLVYRHQITCKWALRSIFVVMLFCSGKILLSLYTGIQLNATFNQRLVAISPFITDQEEKAFKSKWALMTKREDFLAINSELEVIAVKNKIRLPSSDLN